MSAYRDPVEALAARQVALTSEVEDKTRELAAATQLLEEARAKARLPILDNLRVASPCTAEWAQMTGDDRVRACASCQKNVYNLSELTREEAEALILEKNGDLCGRYFQRKDGTILLKDCQVGVARARKRRVLAAGAVALLGGAGALTALWRSAEEPRHAPSGSCFAQSIAVEREEQEPVIEPQIEAQLEELEDLIPEDQLVTMGLMVGPSPEELAADLAAKREELQRAKRRVAEARAALARTQLVQPQRDPVPEGAGDPDETGELKQESPSPVDLPSQ